MAQVLLLKMTVRSALELEAKYGSELGRPPLSEASSPYRLRIALAARNPSIKVSEQLVKTWYTKYRVPADAEKLPNATVLEDKYGESIRHMVHEYPTGYKLSEALRQRTPPLYVTRQICDTWLSKYRGAVAVTNVDNAGHLELLYGDRIRGDSAAKVLGADALCSWLHTTVSVSVPARTCQKWLSMDWSSSGKLLTAYAVEDAAGERLRLDQYKLCFGDGLAAAALAEVLAEGQPPVLVDGLTLRQWYVKYHPDSGPYHINTTEQLEESFGSELRSTYAGFKAKRIVSALGKRRKVVLVGLQVCRNWVEKFGQQPAAAGRMKRPAAAPAGRMMKRPACASSAPSAVSGASSAVQKIEGMLMLEETCGERYRREVSDLGLGFAVYDMKSKLQTWGYEASRESCQEWLKRYRLGDGAKDGGVAVYDVYREDLLRWYHVDSLGPTAMQDRLRAEHGVYADRSHLLSWLKAAAQVLPTLDNNESIHTHACGEYVLDRLQNGVSAEAVVEGLLREYLVRTTTARVQAYRFYREQRGKYWTSERLERLQWEFLYGQVSLDRRILPIRSKGVIFKRQGRMIKIREALCREMGMAEELVPLHNLRVFWKRHEDHATLALRYPAARIIKDGLPFYLVDAYRKTFRGQKLPDTGFQTLRMKRHGSYARAVAVASQSRYIAMPLSCHEACLQAAFAMLKCQELYAQQNWDCSRLTPVQREFTEKYPCVDFYFWVMYGSWSFCGNCGSFFFNDKYFSEAVYRDQVTSTTPDLLAPYRKSVPTDPLEHAHGHVGISSRWWYLPGMYKPVQYCGRCTRPPRAVSPGMSLTTLLRKRNEKYVAAQKRQKSATSEQQPEPVEKTGQLYKIPRMALEGAVGIDSSWAVECVTWPRYLDGEFKLTNRSGDRMLDMTEDEKRALQIVVLRCEVKQERYGAAHQVNWKKTGLSRAYFKSDRVSEGSMPTPRAAAAYRFLMAENQFYAVFSQMQGRILENKTSLNLSTYDLFIVQCGIECAMFPHLYPTTDFTDTGIMKHYKHTTGDDTNRICSIGLSYTRKVLSSVRVYGEQRDLAFFLYEKHLAMKFFNAHVRAKRMGVTGDVMVRDSQSSAGYWEIVQDSLADVVRIMLVRCYDEKNYPELYKHVRDLRGQVWLAAFPNLFITVAPAEWRFPRPYFLRQYLNCVFAGAYIMALHMYYLVRCVWFFLANRFGHQYFIVYEWVMKTEYQGRGTPHWHIAGWIVCAFIMRLLAGRTGTAIVSLFVCFLEKVFQCEIDVQVGNGRLNYINGYIAKDHDAIDVGLGEYVQKESTASWLAAYRLLSKSTPCIPEVAIRMAQLSEFERSYTHVLLYPPQPAAMVDYDGRQGNFSAKMYGIYLAEKRLLRITGMPVTESFLEWHRLREYDSSTQSLVYRGGKHNQARIPTMVCACRYWYELTDGYWGQFMLTQVPLTKLFSMVGWALLWPDGS